MNSRRAVRGVAAAVLVAVAGLGMGGCVGWGPLDTGTQSLTAAASPAGVLDVETANGRIEVRRGDVAELQVQATIKARGQDRLAQTQVVVEPSSDGGSRVYVKWPDGQRMGNEGCSFVVITPGVGGVSLRTSNGEVISEGLSGPLSIRTSNGTIGVRDHQGSVRAVSSNGRIDASRVIGDLDLATSNGRIETYDVSGLVRASTSNGSLAIRLNPDSVGPLDLDTSNGSVTVQVGSAFAGVVDAKTSNGSINVTGATEIEGSRKRCTVRFGDSLTKSVIRTSNGTVLMTRGD